MPLYILAYNVGGLVTGNPTPLVLPPDVGWSWAELMTVVPTLFSWIGSMGHTLVIGLAIQCTVFAVAGYAAVMIAWRAIVAWAWRTRHERRARASR